jgi:predicted transposase YbfD/YdcC
MALADQVDELTAQRADVTVAQAAEIRRIERDLHDGPQARLVALGLSLATMERPPALRPDALRRPPHEATVRRALQAVSAGEVDRVFAAWLAARQPIAAPPDPMPAVAVDGKTIRGACEHGDEDSRAPHLVSAVTHGDEIVLSQRQVDDKSNEITAVQPLLNDLDLAGVVVAADAMHTQRAFAEWLVTVKLAHYLHIVTANQPTLYEAVQAALSGYDTAFADRMSTETDRGHGRTETRTIRTATAEDIDFPHSAQIVRLRRGRGTLDGVRTSKQIVYGITSLPENLAGSAHLAALSRGHWSTENRVHYLRDVTWGEDQSQIRTGNAHHGRTTQPRHRHPPPSRRSQHRESPTQQRAQRRQTSQSPWPQPNP